MSGPPPTSFRPGPPNSGYPGQPMGGPPGPNNMGPPGPYGPPQPRPNMPPGTLQNRPGPPNPGMNQPPYMAAGAPPPRPGFGGPLPPGGPGAPAGFTGGRPPGPGPQGFAGGPPGPFGQPNAPNTGSLPRGASGEMRPPYPSPGAQPPPPNFSVQPPMGGVGGPPPPSFGQPAPPQFGQPPPPSHQQSATPPMANRTPSYGSGPLAGVHPGAMGGGGAPPPGPGFAAPPIGGAQLPSFGAAPPGAGGPPPPTGAAPSATASSRSRRVYANLDSQPPPSGMAGGVPPMPSQPQPFSASAGPMGVVQSAQGAAVVPQPPLFVSPAAPPQFGRPASVAGAPQPPQFDSQPQQGGYGGSQQPQQPAGYGGAAPGYSPIPQMTQGVQSMSISGQRSVPVTNLLGRPTNPNETAGSEMSATWMSPQFSVSQAPTAVCPSSFKRCTLNAIPQNAGLLSKSKIPFGLIVTPYRHPLPGEEPVPVINPPQIVRCRRCRTYINPWVQFVEQGTRWKCNMCFLTNEVPSFFDWDTETRAHVDRMKRLELTHSVVEYVAPQEYMVRPPQPVVMVFVVDVSFPSIQNGMLAVACKTILDTLDKIPNTDNRTKIGFITVDHALHFYNLNANLSEPQMLVVSDLDESFLPLPYDLLVTLSESRSVIEKLLTSLPQMFQHTTSSQNALGRALLSAFKLISHIGGKIVVMQSSLPTIADGSLKAREDPKVLGTPKEVVLLQPANGFYKSLAVDCSRSQVSIDIFAFSPQYADIATLSGCAKFTGGSVYYYPAFTAGRPEDVLKFSSELSHFLSRPIGLEAVLRVRASRGIRMSAFHGNFFLRSSDLLALPNVSPDNSYAIEMQIQDNITAGTACFQTALLHTSSTGERRIRVITLALPVTQNLGDLFASADQLAITALVAKKGVEKAISNNIDAARDEVLNNLQGIMNAYKNAFTSSGQSAQLLVPENLALLPLLSLGLLKNIAFRTSGIVPSDVRSYTLSMLYVYPPELCATSIHARFWALHAMGPNAGLPDDATGQIVFPPLLNLSAEKLDRAGLYLLENGTDMFIWVGRGISPELCRFVFEKPSYEAIMPGKVTLPRAQNEWSQRVNNLIDKIRELRVLMMTTYPHLYVVKEDGDPNLKMTFLSQLIEDRVDQSHSYPQFLSILRDKVNKNSSF